LGRKGRRRGKRVVERRTRSSRRRRRLCFATHTEQRQQRPPFLPSPQRSPLLPPALDQAYHPPVPFLPPSLLLAPFLGLHYLVVECLGV